MGNTTREISNFVENLYGFSVSAEMVSNITDKIIPEMNEWKARRLDDIYPFVFIKVAFPKTDHQTHFVRNTLKYVNHRDKAKFA